MEPVEKTIKLVNELIDKIIILWDELFSPTVRVFHDVPTHIIDAHDSLYRFLRAIPYTWYGIDPLIYSAELKNVDGELIYVQSRIDDTEVERLRGIEFVPEIASLIHSLLETLGLTGKDPLYYSPELRKGLFPARRSLEEIRSRLKIHLEALGSGNKRGTVRSIYVDGKQVFSCSLYCKTCKLTDSRGRTKTYPLTIRQGRIVLLLFRAYQNGFPDLGQDEIMRALGKPVGRFRDTFRSREGVLGTLIVPGKAPGTVRLNIPDPKGA